MEALGRLFNVHPLADDVYVNMRYAAAVTFIGYNAAGETWTLTEAKDASGTSAQVLATITRYHVQATAGAAWVLVPVSGSAASAVVTTSAQDGVAIHVAGVELSDTYTHLKLTSTSTGTVVAITHDLTPQRAPENLPVITT